jgi:hypothetical protein
MPKFRIVQIYEKYVDLKNYDEAHEWIEHTDLADYNYEVLVENIEEGDEEC